jgi:REP element-mobilizing transposase RayT
MLTPRVERRIYELLTSKATGLGGMVFALGGTEDHVHVVAAIPPSISVARFVGQVKGVASARLNQTGISSQNFAWQAEYGVFSFDGKRLPNVRDYVQRQKEHHATNTVIPLLERMASEDVGPRMVRDEAIPYLRDQDEWMTTMQTRDARMPLWDCPQ